MSDLWYVRTIKKDRGPYETAKLRDLAATGKVKPTTLISRDGKQTWIKASRVKGLEFGTREPDPNAKPKKRKRPVEEEIDTGFDARYGGGTAKRGRDVVDSYGNMLEETGNRTMARVYVIAAYTGGAGMIVFVFVRLAARLGLISYDSVQRYLMLRLGLPLIAAGIGFAVGWWRTRHLGGRPPMIDPDMSDEEIAREIRREW